MRSFVLLGHPLSPDALGSPDLEERSSSAHRRHALARSLAVALLLGSATWLGAPAALAEEPAEDGEATAAEEDEMLRFAVAFSGTRWIPSTELAATDPVVIDPDGTVTLSVEPDDVVVPLFGIRYWLSDVVGLDVAVGFNVESGSVTATRPNADPSLTQQQESSTPSTLAFAGRVGLPLAVYSTDHYRFLLMPEIDLGYTSKTLEAFAPSTAGEPLDMRLTGFVFGAGGRVGAEANFGFVGIRNLAIQSAWGVRFETRRRVGRIGDAEVVQADNGFGTSWYGDPFDIFFGSLALNYYL